MDLKQAVNPTSGICESESRVGLENVHFAQGDADAGFGGTLRTPGKGHIC